MTSDDTILCSQAVFPLGGVTEHHVVVVVDVGQSMWYTNTIRITERLLILPNYSLPRPRKNNNRLYDYGNCFLLECGELVS